MLKLSRTNTGPIGRWWWTVDRLTFFAILLLIAMGVFFVLAASPAVAIQHKWSSFYFVKRHLAFLVPTLLILIGVSLAPPEQIKKIALIALGISIILMALTFFIGTEIKGARRWINVAGLSLQPSEFAKPAFAVVAAWIFSEKMYHPHLPSGLMVGGLYLLVVGLLLLQPDLGMAFVITLIWLGLLFLAGLSLWWIATIGIGGVIGLVGAYFLFPHVTKRVDRFLSPSPGDRYGDRFQILQSLDAFKSGGFLGQGPGEGSVKKNLPDAHADFIFAVVGEEFGWVVCFAIVCLFMFILIRSFIRLLNQQDMFALLAGAGLLIQFGIQTLINMASTLNLMPTKGMTLPFISYGGSSMLALALGVGMLLGLTRRRVVGLP